MNDYMTLGEGIRYDTDCVGRYRNKNVMCLGPSGSGKTTGYMYSRLMGTFNSSLMVSVSKRRVIDMFEPVFRSRGYRTYVIDFAHPEKSQIGFDPLFYAHKEREVHSLAEFLVLAAAGERKENHSDPFWDNSSIDLMEAVLSFELYRPHPSMAAAVERVRKMVIQVSDNGEDFVTSLDDLFVRLKRAHPDCYGLTGWASFKGLPFRTASCVLGTLKSSLAYSFTPELLRMIKSKPSFRFEEMGQEKTALFVYTSAMDPPLNHLTNLFYSQAIKDLFEYAESCPDGSLPIPVDFHFDDFANGGRIRDFPEYISIFREKGISVSLLFQSESQLRSMYGDEDAVTIINNCDTSIYLGGTDLDTCESVSKRANVPFMDVYTMPVGKEYLFRRGEKAVFTDTYDIFADAEFREILDAYNRRPRKAERNFD